MNRESVDLLRYPRRKHRHRKMRLLNQFRKMHALCDELDGEGFHVISDAIDRIMIRMAVASQPIPQATPPTQSRQHTIDELRADLASVNAQITNMTPALHGLQGRIAQDSAPRDAGVSARIVSNQQALTKMSQQYRGLLTQQATLQRELSGITVGTSHASMFRSSQEQQPAMNPGIQGRINQLINELRNLQQRQQDLQKNLNSLQGQPQAMQQVKALSTEMQQVMSRIAEINAEMAELQRSAGG